MATVIIGEIDVAPEIDGVSIAVDEMRPADPYELSELQPGQSGSPLPDAPLIRHDRLGLIQQDREELLK